MSSLRGEQALKDGLSFEFTWAVRHLLEVMDEGAQAIMLGGLPGEAGVDLRLYYADYEEHHQVKRAFGTAGSWTLAALESENILSDFKRRLMDDKVHCHMVSGILAHQLGYLGDRARSSSDFAEFESSYLTAEYSKWFCELVRRWDLPREECWSRLRRVHAVVFDEPRVTKDCNSLLRMLVVDGTAHAWTHLREFCLTHVQQKVTSSQLWQWLQMKGIERQVVNNDPHILARLRAQTDRYLNGVRRKLFKPQLPRQVSANVIKELAESTWGKDIVLLGSPGGGKSAVMLEIADAAIARGWPVLAFRLDDLSASLTTRGLQEELELPAPPSMCLAHASAGAPALVIIDQLDAVSQYSGRTGSLFDRVADLVGELRAHRLRHPIHLVLACREADWKHDKRLPDLHSATKTNPDEGVHTVQKLEESEIQRALASANLTLAMFTASQREQLLSRPQYLALMIDSSLDAQSITRIITPKHLFDAYWDKKQNDLSHEFESLPGNPWYDILKSITDKLAETALALALAPDSASAGEDDAPLAVMRRSLDRFPSRVVKWLIANGVLAEGNGRVRFGHESFFDYCFARFFEERGESLHDYLVRSDQTLIQRGQLRQVLAYQRDEDMQLYLASVRELLASDRIRPHLIHLLATIVCSPTEPTEAEWQLVAPIIADALRDFEGDANTSTACQIFSAFSGSLPLFKIACEKGAFAEWLHASGEKATLRLLHMLRMHQGKMQREVWSLLEPLIKGGRYHAQLIDLSDLLKASDSRETFDWLLGVMRGRRKSGEARSDAWDRFYSLTEDLAKHKPEWLAEWIAATIDERAKAKRPGTYELLHSGDLSTEQDLAIRRVPKTFLVHVLPAIQSAIQKGVEHSFGPCLNEETASSPGMHIVSPDEALFESVVHAFCQMFDLDTAYVLETLDQLRNSHLPEMRTLYAIVLCQDHPACAPLVASHLTTGGAAFEAYYKRGPAAFEMIKVHASRLSDDHLSAIAAAVLQYWPKHQNEKREGYGREASMTCLGNWRGRQQMLLLRAFPTTRLTDVGRKRLAELERKFDSVKALFGPRRKETQVNKEVVSTWAPGRFLQAIDARQNRPLMDWRGPRDRDHNIASVLSEAAAKRPAEFIDFLSQCDLATPNSFLDAIDTALMNLEMDSELALKAAKEFHRLGTQWSWPTLRLLQKVRPGPGFHEAFSLALDYARNGEGVKNKSRPEEGKRGQHLHMLGQSCARGQAIDALGRMLWSDPGHVNDLKPFLPAMMSDPCPAIRAEAAFLCYAVAFKEDNVPLATELFEQLANDQLPDEHVLTSHWPYQFMRTGLRNQWDVFRPILLRMLASSSVEVQITSARLVCIAAVIGLPAIDIAKTCVASPEPAIRTACAEVLARNLDLEAGRPWTTEALLELANDADKGVCQAISFGNHRVKGIDFSSLSAFLMRYVRTRAFVRGAGRFVDAVVESRSVLPATVFDMLDVLMNRLYEPVEEGSDRLVWHVNRLGPLLIRLYHENRDGVLRRRALDLIDKLCATGSISHDSLDQ